MRRSVLAAATLVALATSAAGTLVGAATAGLAGRLRQLENEMARGDWITVASDPALVFDDDAAGKWERARAREVIRL